MKNTLYVDGVGRSGTTVTLQVTKAIGKMFGYTAESGGHGFCYDRNKYNFIIIRNLKDIMVSRWRIELSILGKYNECLERKMNEGEIMTGLGINPEGNYNGVMIQQIKSLIKFFELHYNANTYIISYEKVRSDLNYLIDTITTPLDISLTLSEREEIIKNHNIDVNKKILSGQDGLKIDGVWSYGHHVFKGENNTWKKYIPEKYYDLIEEKLLPYEAKILKFYPEYKK
tara:strand:- start:5109 stop:5792 length:684 start_codon:yes stop_codon:yes gene_type:complete